MKQNKTNCDLCSCLLCKQCLPDWLPAIDVNRQALKYKKGELIFSEGTEVKGMYFISKGLVKVHKQWGLDKELIVRIAGDGDILGHRGIGVDNIYPVAATALETTTICFISLNFFNNTLKVNHHFLYELMMFFASELKESEKKMRNLAHMSVKGRVANAVLSLQQKFGIADDGFIDIVLSRQDLASYTGTTYETLFRTINELLEEQAIKTEGKRIKILRPDLLTQHTAEA